MHLGRLPHGRTFHAVRIPPNRRETANTSSPSSYDITCISPARYSTATTLLGRNTEDHYRLQIDRATDNTTSVETVEDSTVAMERTLNAPLASNRERAQAYRKFIFYRP
ncbi:MAG: hypothetical protein MK364_09300 [Pirellulales bacterium]|nr:hypothetical protein [Pirellulales bacterium]